MSPGASWVRRKFALLARTKVNLRRSPDRFNRKSRIQPLTPLEKCGYAACPRFPDRSRDGPRRSPGRLPVTRLSILIPFLGNRDSLENTLASVLQNRPEGAEIVVALGQDYDDPYQLGEEVRFVRAAGATTLAAALNQGFAACQAPIVHTLACGATVGDGWTDRALRRFDDRRIASVAPVIAEADHPQRVWSTGLEYRAGGACRRLGQGVLIDSAQSGRPADRPELGGGFLSPLSAGRSLADFRSGLGTRFRRRRLGPATARGGIRFDLRVRFDRAATEIIAPGQRLDASPAGGAVVLAALVGRWPASLAGRASADGGRRICTGLAAAESVRPTCRPLPGSVRMGFAAP